MCKALSLIHCLCTFLLFPFFLAQAYSSDLITYEFSGGRFGDNLLAYLHAKWISYRHQMPLLYKPFPYSSCLALDEIELPYDPNYHEKLITSYITKDFDSRYRPKTITPKLYICAYFPESNWERATFLSPKERQHCFEIDWKDLGFREIAKQMILPKRSYSLTHPPAGRISIALHVREGGGYDTGDFNMGFLTKFPPIEFYVQGLLEVIRQFPGKSFYCFLFTDALDPLSLLEVFKKSVPSDTKIIFDCREQNNAHTQNVLEDFYSLFLFDVLIHPQSNFSIIPALLHDYAITFSPSSATKINRSVTIDEVTFNINKKLCRKLRKNS